MTGLKSGYFYTAAVWVTALVLALITYLQPGTHLWPGLDQAWAYGLNYAFAKGLIMGRDIHFTFGPLGWLEHTRMVSRSMFYISSLFSLLVSVAMYASVLHLAWQVSAEKYLRRVNVALALALIVFSFPEMHRLLVLGYALVLLHWITRRDLYLHLLIATVPFCVFIKFSYGVAALTLLFSYLALLYYNERKLKTIYVALGSLALAYVGLWLLTYQTLSGIIGYLEGELHISSGNASAMALNPENNWWAIAGFYVAILAAALMLHRNARYRFLPLVFVLPLFVWTKYTFAQEQALHFVPILAFVVYVIGLFVVLAPSWLQKISLTVLLAGSCYAWRAMHTETVGSPDYVNVPHVTINKPELLQYGIRLKRLYNMWRNAESKFLESLVLPPDMRSRIGDARVDIYPWELNIAAVNKLNWQPRPAFQTYVAYMPFLDGKNRDFYSSPHAPDYIVWHHHEFQDVMNRYALSSEPMTTESMLRHYKLLYCEGIFCLWQRAEHEQLLPVLDQKTETVTWNEWIPVSPELTKTTDIVRAKIFAKRTWLGKLNLLAWKEGGIEVDYQLTNGVIKTHDLLIDNAVSGVWISPYVDQYWGQTSARPEAISKQQLNKILAQAPAQGYIDRVEPTLMGQRLVGWAFMPVNNTLLQQQYVLIFNAENSFLKPADNYNRSDVVEYFQGQGKQISGQCGFYEEIAEQQIPAGDYKLRFVVKYRDNDNAEQWASIPDQGLTLHIGTALRKNEVLALRFRTTRPWAFVNKIRMQWQSLNFSGPAP